MSLSGGFTDEQVREFVHEYQLVPYGKKAAWLAGQSFTRHMLARWRSAVFEGDLDRGLVPRESSGVSVPPGKRTALEKERARERAAHEAEVARLTARVRELEDTNQALGKAIGLLHAMSEEEPDAPQTPTDRSGS